MCVIGGTLGRHLLRHLAPKDWEGRVEALAYRTSKLELLLGTEFFDLICGKTVIDFGCGSGAEAVEMAQRGARRVLGIEINPRLLEQARQRAISAGVADRCVVATAPDEPADVIVSLDSFEHFADPLAILQVMAEYLKPGGRVIISFGPTWYHPYGGHFFSVFPWSHLLFTESALIEWRRTRRPGQSARTISECGVNKMTIRGFRRIVDASPFRFAYFEARPIRRLARLSNALTREFCTSIVRCTLVHKESAASSWATVAA
jgi:SAM-dependent methyltransferase